MHLPGYQSDNHGGRGQNVLFEDNHVRFVVNTITNNGGDAFFRNHDGFVAPGVNENDSVIGGSAASPFFPF